MPSGSSVASTHLPSVGIVVLTMGDRGAELAALSASVSADSAVERLIVTNGAAGELPTGWTVEASETNVGVPGGRALGVGVTTADVLIFLDDDCVVVTADLVARVQQHFAGHPDLGALGFRIRVSGADHSLKRWVPTARKRLDNDLVQAVTFPGGGHALRRSSYVDVGGYCTDFFFKHEETQLAWRLLDGGYEVAFADQLVIEHPATSESRHRDAVRVGCRNKVWLARMALPRGLVSIAVAVTTARHLSRCRSRADIQNVAQGVRLGLASLPDRRAPMQWRTIAELTRRGRCPIL